MNENEIGTIVLDIAFNLHKSLGPGLLENVYEVILAKLISKKGLYVQRQVAIPIRFEDESFDEAFRVDLFIQGKVIVELKSIDKVSEVHKKQLLTYLRLTNTKLGYMINFGEEYLKNGIFRVINGFIN